MEQEVRTIRIWKEIIEGAGQYLMLYCNKDWWNKLRAIDAKLIDSIDLWLAHWGISEPSVNCRGFGNIQVTEKLTDQAPEQTLIMRIKIIHH